EGITAISRWLSESETTGPTSPRAIDPRRGRRRIDLTHPHGIRSSGWVALLNGSAFSSVLVDFGKNHC
ncbi:MAG: hypothetical protein O2955_09205, partial [Planctomycetota bacterium]|nr:hypothetical protein [Planctomycetota bacterium]